MRGAMLATVAAALMAAVLFQGTEGRAQDGVEAAYRAARAGSPTPGALEQSQAEWRLVRAAAVEAGEPTDDDLRTEWLSWITARDTAARAARTTLAGLSQACVATGLMGCDTRQGGFLSDGEGHILYWQLQDGALEETGITGGIVFLVADGDRLRPVAWATEAARYQTPVLIGQDEHLFIATSGILAGSGSGNADVIFRWTPGGARELTEVDDWSWRETLDDRLPNGLAVWQGVRWNWDNMIALTGLWRWDDANCCASGGDAVLDFTFEGDRLVLTGVNVTDTAVQAVARTPTPVLDHVRRAQICAQWAGEERNPDLPPAVRERITGARCSTLEADAEALMDRYSGDRAVTELISRAGVR